MKVKVDDLEKAINWMKKHSSDPMCNVQEVECGLVITSKDRYDKYVEMKLSMGGTMTPKIIKEEEIP
jgi:hypothetical protein